MHASQQTDKPARRQASTATHTLHRLVAIGFRTYCKSGWNVFDAVITILSIVSVLIVNLSESNVSFLPVLRVLRVVRIFRLIPRAKGLRRMLRTLYM